MVTQDDIKGLLNLTQRPRTKEFLYFPFIRTEHEGRQVPIDHQAIYNVCLKEKTVNHIIHHLTKYYHLAT